MFRPPREQKQSPHPKVLTKSWEEWVIDKALGDLKNTQIQKEERQKKKLEEKAANEEKIKRDKRIEENRLKWLSQKKYECEKQENEKAAQKEYERLKREQKQDIISTRAKQAYDEWVKKKEEHQLESKAKQQQHTIEMRQKLIKRRQLNDTAYKKWQKKVKPELKERPKTAPYSNNDLLGYSGRAVGPLPGYVNPVAWQGLAEDPLSSQSPSEFFRGYNKFQSPPLLWKNYEERLKHKSTNKHNLRADCKSVEQKRRSFKV